MAGLLQPQVPKEMQQRVLALGGTPEEQADIQAGVQRRINDPRSLALFLDNLKRQQMSLQEMNRAGNRGVDVVRK